MAGAVGKTDEGRAWALLRVCHRDICAAAANVALLHSACYTSNLGKVQAYLYIF